MLKGKNLFWLKAVTALAVLALCLGPALTGAAAFAADSRLGDAPPAGTSSDGTNSPTITTDKPDYTPIEVPVISGEGFIPNSEVNLTITLPDGSKAAMIATADDNGRINVGFVGGLTKGEYTVTASDGTNTATTTFLDATLIIPAYQDSYVSKNNPGQNYNSVTPIKLHAQSGEIGNTVDDCRVYIMFDLNNPSLVGVTINSAQAVLHEMGGGGQQVPYGYLGKTDFANSWSETTITWNNQPGYVLYPQKSQLPAQGQNDFYYDVGDFVIAGLASTGKYLTLVLAYNPEGQTTKNNYQDFSPRENPQGPYLKIDYTPACPDNPPTLTKTLEDSQGNTEPTGNNGWWVTKPIYVTLIATDDKGVQSIYYYQTQNPNFNTYTIYPNSPVSTSQTLTDTITAEGITYLGHKTLDTSGQWGYVYENGQLVERQTVKIDTVAPSLDEKTIDGAAPKSGWYNISDVGPDNKLVVVLKASDYEPGSGVDYIKFRVGSESEQKDYNPDYNTGTAVPEDKDYSHTATFYICTDDGSGNPINQGTITLYHSAVDVAGNEGSGTVGASQQIKIDTVAPSLAKSAARTDATEVTVTLVGTDATSGVDYIRYSVDGGETWAQAPVVNNYGPNTFQATFTVDGVGEHELSHLVFDVAGNQYVLGDQMITIERPTPSGTMLYTPRLIITLDILGTTAEYPVTPEGRLITDARVTSPDGSVTLEIPAGTLVLNADRTPTYLNEDYDIVFMNAAPPAAPAGYQIVAAYQAHPAGLTFSRDARLIITYDESKLPQGSSAVIAYYDEAKKEWTPLETAGYVAAGGIEIPNTVVSRVGHFTYFAVLAKLPAAK